MVERKMERKIQINQEVTRALIPILLRKGLALAKKKRLRLILTTLSICLFKFKATLKGNLHISESTVTSF